MHIRPGQLSDIPSIIRLGRQLFDVHAQFDRDYYQIENNFDELFRNWANQYLASSSQFILVSENDSREITGFIAGFIKSLYPWFIVKSVGHIAYLVVDPIYRKNGVGKMLNDAAANWFKEKKVTYIELYVEEKNGIGQTAWSSYGFMPFKKFLRKKI